MKTTVSLKKAVALITAVCMLTALVAAFGMTSASAQTTDVSLYSTEVTFCKYGITARNIYVKTDCTSFHQSVTIHYNYLNGEEWRDAQAREFTTLSDGSKIWVATISSYNTEYAIKYVANGNTYWDNNNGQNYTDETCGTAPITVKRGGYFCMYNNTVTAVLQNYAYDKEVVIRYTNDNWNTYQDEPLNYESTNDNGTENWATHTVYVEDPDSFEFCVYYNVDGETYWANNFNQNYDTTYRVYP